MSQLWPEPTGIGNRMQSTVLLCPPSSSPRGQQLSTQTALSSLSLKQGATAFGCLTCASARLPRSPAPVFVASPTVSQHLRLFVGREERPSTPTAPPSPLPTLTIIASASSTWPPARPAPSPAPAIAATLTAPPATPSSLPRRRSSSPRTALPSSSRTRPPTASGASTPQPAPRPPSPDPSSASRAAQTGPPPPRSSARRGGSPSLPAGRG
mmetsp:Transcript_43951/g.92026  ORF Transcript_43951/g.92026 Transcript_43951/m.92026 type:complete len:211 (+) Transcript_43951:208-840(+)